MVHLHQFPVDWRLKRLEAILTLLPLPELPTRFVTIWRVLWMSIPRRQIVSLIGWCEPIEKAGVLMLGTNPQEKYSHLRCVAIKVYDERPAN